MFRFSRTLVFALVSALLALGVSAHAQTFTEVGDAGETPATAQTVTNGATTIIGTISPVTDADMYRLFQDGTLFTASTIGGADFDTILALFNSTGTLLLVNDDSGGTLQSFISFTPPSAGEYLLGISSFANFPLLNDPPYGIYPGFESGPYRIALTGVAPAVPEPGTLALAATGLLPLAGAVIRKRRKA